ncbi:MAG: YbaK/EbsC family protein [Clostridiales bacterium]|nr:YbaK/EbsC family protein [Clostridiales bacterium]
MSIQPVREYFAARSMENRILEFDVSSATVELAAKALQCDPARIAKSLTFLLNDEAVMIVAAGDARIHNAKYKALFGVKARMLTPEQVLDMTGHAVGGVCPFALNAGVRVYLDESLKRFETVFPACGSANSAIELTIPELEKYAAPLGWVDVCRLPDS